MRRGILSLLIMAALITLFIILIFVIGAILWDWLWLFIVVIAVILIFDWFVGPRYLGRKATITVETKKIVPCDAGFHLENGKCLPN